MSQFELSLERMAIQITTSNIIFWTTLSLLHRPFSLSLPSQAPPAIYLGKIIADMFLQYRSSLSGTSPNWIRFHTLFSMELSRPRWKGKGFADIAQANPMSGMVSQLQGSLTQSKTYAMLSGCDILLEAELELADLLSKASFGRAIVTSNKDKQWFQLGPEEAFYLCHALKCLKVSRDETCMSEMELWDYFTSKREAFPMFYKAYFYLRSKNWVVRSGIQYGVDYVAYRHHPALVHSEYAVLVVSDGDGNASSGRLRVWSDLHCTLRVCGSVAKTLLVLTVRRYGSDKNSLNCLEEFIVEERTITRWVPERSREDQGLEEALGVD